MNTKGIEALYQKIGSAVSAMIPEKWQRVMLYAEVEEDRSTVIFYYYTDENNKPVYSLDIEDFPGIDKQYINSLYDDLMEYIRSLWEEFRTQKQQVWSSLTMQLFNVGKFNIYFDYSEFDESRINIVQRQMLWKYKNLGIQPTHKADVDFLKKYLKKAQKI
ncbi:immunity protein YezG family protein [Endomicrobium proavitum]|uniref:Cytoplasmic protein n=1 Tax=Endomicrobium proavitum TaxID=1408281 RepID=A0A0G3WHS5_9BACT|nr:immunity protein YezG family protein [Endomicrobium proavitum]AKL98211.1 hypothetical protein Epro_0832 [Endomicrobium proavitum]